jgi:hypothetical protein
MRAMADIFISYAREDKAIARHLASALEEREWSVWWDHDLLGGQDFRAEIQKKLDEARSIVVLWSAHSVESGFVINEAGEGLHDGRLIPVLLEDVEPPLGFRHLHAVPLTNWAGEQDEQFERLVASIQAAMAREAARSGSQPTVAVPRPAPSWGDRLKRRVGETPRAWIGSFLLLASPLFILAADYVWRPIIWAGCTSVSAVSVDRLLGAPFLPLGTLLGHELTVGLDDFNSSSFKTGDGTPQAIVTTVFFENPLVPEKGQLTQALLEAISRVSTTNHVRLLALLNDPSKLVGGAVHSYEMTALERSRDLPLDRIYVIVVQYNRGEEGHANDGATIAKGLRTALARASEDRVGRLLVPSLGVNWEEDAGWLTHADFYQRFFSSIEPVSRPPVIRLSLYENTPRPILQQAVNAINDTFAERCAVGSEEDVLIRQLLRAVLLSLFLCLLVSCIFTPVTIKNTLIIAASYVALSTAVLSVVDQLVRDYGTGVTRLLTQGAILALLALSFPIIIRWNPQDVFQASRRL